MANQFLGLSLFIMLLSFFIILNSMSNFDVNKATPVLNSLSISFSKKEFDKDAAPNFQEDISQASFRDGDTMSRLEDLFHSQISGVDIRKNRLGTVMHIRVSLEKFENEIMMPASDSSSSQGVALGGVGGSFAPALTSVLLSSEAAIPYQLDMILNTAENPSMLQNAQPQEIDAKIKKVTSFAERLEEAGLPKKFVTAGVGKGEDGMIDLFFRRYTPFNPLGSDK